MKDENKMITDQYQAIYPELVSEEQALEADIEMTRLISLLIEIDKS